MFIHDQIPSLTFSMSEDFFAAMVMWKWYDQTQAESEDAVMLFLAA
jgi:hypothetical protein